MEGPSTADGTNIQQCDFHGHSKSRWIITLEANSGYYLLKSEYSNKYIGVDTNSTSTNPGIKQYSFHRTNANIRWELEETDDGAYKLLPKSRGSSDRVMAVPIGTTSNGTDLIETVYTNDTNYKDEWIFYPYRYGIQAYRTETSENVNCHGHAMMRNDKPAGWYNNVLTYINSIDETSITGNNDYLPYIKEDVSEKTREAFEAWLDANKYDFTPEHSFSGNGENQVLAENQYRVVLRTGIHNLYVYNGPRIEITTHKYYDYHFWYQTYDGRWANKHGDYPSEHMEVGITPFSSDESGWDLGNYDNFYDGTIYSYIITIN